MTPSLTSNETATRTPISAVLLTKNEELIVERCIRSLYGVVDDIIVLDSGSTDRTREIAAQLGARVFEQSWLGWIDQRAKAISLAAHDWVLIIEADEIVTPALASSIRNIARHPMQEQDGYSMDRRDDFAGKLLPRMRRRSRRLSFVRLFNRKYNRYDPSIIIHDEVRVVGKTIPLAGPLIHWRGFTILEQVRRYVEYAPLEAEVMQLRGARVRAWHLIVRPFLRFGWCYFACGGFRLGGRGFAHALMVAASEFLRHAALWERQLGGAALHPPAEVLDAFPGDHVMQPSSVPLLSPLITQSSTTPRTEKTISLTGTAA